MLKHRSHIRVRYADTDKMGIIYYGKYFEYFEQGRSDLLRAIGLPYPEVERQGIYLPVIEASARYRKSASYDEMIILETVVPELPVARIRLEYRVFREGDEEPLVEGHTIHSFLNSATGKPTRAPAFFLHTLEKAFTKHPE